MPEVPEFQSRPSDIVDVIVQVGTIMPADTERVSPSFSGAAPLHHDELDRWRPESTVPGDSVGA